MGAIQTKNFSLEADGDNFRVMVKGNEEIGRRLCCYMEVESIYSARRPEPAK